jgi:hypothetical protein
MGFMVDYNGGIHAEDYVLVDHGDGNGFGLRSACCSILNHFETEVEEGVIQLTIEHVSHTHALSLGDAERVVMTAEDAEDLIDHLKDAIEEAEGFQLELREKTEAKAKKMKEERKAHDEATIVETSS